MKSKCSLGCGAAAFGVGLLAATVLPPKVILVLAAIALVCLGCSVKR